MLSFFLRLYQIDLSNTQSIKNQNWYGVFFCINWFFFPFPFLSQIFFFSSISFLELATISNSNLLRTFSWLGSIGFNLKIKMKYIELVYFSEIFLTARRRGSKKTFVTVTELFEIFCQNTCRRRAVAAFTNLIKCDAINTK